MTESSLLTVAVTPAYPGLVLVGGNVADDGVRDLWTPASVTLARSVSRVSPRSAQELHRGGAEATGEEESSGAAEFLHRIHRRRSDLERPGSFVPADDGLQSGTKDPSTTTTVQGDGHHRTGEQAQIMNDHTPDDRTPRDTAVAGVAASGAGIARGSR